MPRKKAEKDSGALRGKTEYNVSPQDFCRVWETSETPQEVADRLNMPRPIVLARASFYRKQGVRLKKMKRKTKRSLDVNGLNQMITEIERQLAEQRDAKGGGTRPGK